MQRSLSFSPSGDSLANFGADSAPCRHVAHLVFPDSYYAPSIVNEGLRVLFVPLNVAPYFALPILTIALRELTVAVWTTMPKTPINKDEDSLFREYYIRFSNNVADIFLPAAQSHTGQHGG